MSHTKLLGYAELLTNDMLSIVDVPSAHQGSHKSVTDEPSLLMLVRITNIISVLMSILVETVG